MRSFDFTPYRRSMIGYDRLFDMLEKTTGQQVAEGYPPFDIEKVGEDQFRIMIAVAGFRAEEVEVESHGATLTVRGRKGEENGQRQWLHRGIAARAFERRFELADYIQVQAADLKDGLLVIELRREVPEAMKPRRIAVGSPQPVFSGSAPQQIEGEARAAA